MNVELYSIAVPIAARDQYHYIRPGVAKKVKLVHHAMIQRVAFSSAPGY